MRIIKKAVTTLGSVFLVALLIGALAPKVTHGIVAALVQVANTSAQPVPTRDLAAASEPFFVELCLSYSGGCVFTPDPSEFTVPTNTVDGKTVTRLVVENVSGSCQSDGGGVFNTIFSGNLSTSTENLINGQNAAVLTIPPGPIFPTKAGGAVANSQTFSQPTRFYAEPGDVLSFIYGRAANVTSSTCIEDVEGYLATQ